MGIGVVETDRGGDVTYHGPGQLVVYPIVDLNLLNLGLHDYMRLLEEAVIRYCATHGISGAREKGATGVWVESALHGESAKIAAMGVRVRRWVTMHGLSLNINPDLGHFSCIIPCGLVGRPVTSMHQQMGEGCPSMQEASKDVGLILSGLLTQAYERACQKREGRLSGAGGATTSAGSSPEGQSE
jgi:lipoyl(octanoyl) transferase